MIKWKNFINHLAKVYTHRKWVRHYCFKAGIPIQGILHDLSKYSPIEFWESVKYYQGNRSPIEACKEKNGWSAAWLHHKGKNKHHYEYWQDNFDNGGEPLLMPYRYALEMLCDYLGAGHAYSGNSFTIADELEWWKAKSSKPLAMHPANKIFITLALNYIIKSEAIYGKLDFSEMNFIYDVSILIAENKN